MQFESIRDALIQRDGEPGPDYAKRRENWFNTAIAWLLAQHPSAVPHVAEILHLRRQVGGEGEGES